MQAIAAEVGYSETIFMALTKSGIYETRYYSPKAEVPFCGHATVAGGLFLGQREGEGRFRLATTVGEVVVNVAAREGQLEASLRSVAPTHRQVDDALLADFLAGLGWRHDEVSTEIPPALAYAGAWHLVVALRSRETLDRLDYDFDRVLAKMNDAGLTTLQLVWRESEDVFHARNPFPVGGVVEDPATGAAAAALGGYLRDAGLVTAPFTFTIRQGEQMGRASRLRVTVPAEGGIEVAGNGVDIDDPTSSAMASDLVRSLD
jgi:PhzF family phenazine biosynthesis protein